MIRIRDRNMNRIERFRDAFINVPDEDQIVSSIDKHGLERGIGKLPLQGAQVDRRTTTFEDHGVRLLEFDFYVRSVRQRIGPPAYLDGMNVVIQRTFRQEAAGCAAGHDQQQDDDVSRRSIHQAATLSTLFILEKAGRQANHIWAILP